MNKRRIKWNENIFPKKIFLLYLIAVIICFQIFLIFTCFLIFSLIKNVLIILNSYLIISIIFITYFIYNYKKQKIQSEFSYILTKKGIILRKKDSTIKLIAWKNIRRIREMFEINGVYIHEKNKLWPYLIFGDKNIILAIKNNYNNYQ